MIKKGGYILSEDQLKHLEGRLLTMIESFGLPGNQEASAKSLVSQEVWDLLEPDYIWVEPSQVEEIEKQQ